MTSERSGEQPTVPADDLEPTVLMPRAPSTRAPDVRAADEPDIEQTVVRLIEPSPPPRATPAIAPGSLPSIASGAAASPRGASRGVSRGASRGVEGERSSHTAVRWAVRVRGTTAVVPLDAPVVVGRRPSAQRVPEHPPPRRVVIPADRRDVSGRHARLEQLGDTLVVSDLGSSNGIVVHWSSGSRSRLRPGESVALLPDAVVVLGDGVELEFLAADEPTADRESRPSDDHHDDPPENP